MGSARPATMTPAVGGHADFEGAGGQERRAPHGRRLTGTAVSQGGALRLFRASPLPGSPQPKPSAVTIRGYLLPSMTGRNLRPPRRAITPLERTGIGRPLPTVAYTLIVMPLSRNPYSFTALR